MTDTKNLIALYRVAGRRIRALAMPAAGKMLGSSVTISETRKIVITLNRAVDKWGQQAIADSYSTGTKRAKNILEHMGKRPKYSPQGNYKTMLQDELMTSIIRANQSIPTTVERLQTAQMIAQQAEIQYDKTAMMIQEFRLEESADRINRMAAKAVREDQSRKALTSKIKSYLSDLVDNDEWIEIGNRMYRMTTYAEMLGRTVLREAQTKATLDVCQQYDNDLVQVSDHQTQCEECQEYEGEIYSISGTHPVYPELTAEPPYHPNCEHSLLPTSDIAIETEREYDMY